MSDAVIQDITAAPKLTKTVVLASLLGLIITVIGSGFWVVVAPLNLRWRPELPWAAAATTCWLLILIIWLGGFGWPRSTSTSRRYHLRLWRPESDAWAGDSLVTILGLSFALVGSSVFWILAQTGSPPIDVNPYPTTAIRFSVLIMGAVVSGVVEEVAFRGYMQSHLERIGPTFAILVTSVVFTLMHASHGLQYLISVAPGFFMASVVYGYLALKSGSIIPGMVLHSAGDASHTYFVLLGGNSNLLFAS
jgi:membrane protease YdiL (CAAX protease family)